MANCSNEDLGLDGLEMVLACLDRCQDPDHLFGQYSVAQIPVHSREQFVLCQTHVISCVTRTNCMHRSNDDIFEVRLTTILILRACLVQFF